MSQDDSTERRRAPRVTLVLPAECRLELRTRVRLLDISLTGTLLSSDTQLPVGTQGQLRAGIAAATFAPSLQVRRVSDRASGRETSQGVGAMFVDMDERSRESLEAFLRKASE
jgi:c-di-GMP-binding flagellar brake protein YcgR